VSPGSRIRVFDRIFADIGDEQNLTQNLSTFSGHMKIIAGLLETADEHTLVLLDELGAGTDPQEGSALGIAIMETLHERGACTVITTHHNLLKDFAYRAPYAENASTVFDADTLKPTYSIRMGAAGRSHALQIADRLGLDGRVLDRAREIMGTEVVQVDELLGRLGEEIDRREKARQRAEENAEKLEVARSKQKATQEKHREQVRDIRERTRREARLVIREIEKQGREIIRNIGDMDRESARDLLRGAIVKMEEKVERSMPAVRIKREGGVIKSGDTVWIMPIGVRGRVEALRLGGVEAEVFSGGIRMRVPVKDLSTVSSQDPSGAQVSKSGKVTFSGDGDVGPEINLLGKKVQDALEAVGRFLDRSTMASAHTVRIVHGKGTGALKKAIREVLGKDPRVSSFGPAPLNEGGEGVTVVELKE
jgi:DNA mismatch repair protein MutS2